MLVYQKQNYYCNSMYRALCQCIILFIYPVEIACLQGQFFLDFFTQNFHQGFLVLLAHLLPPDVMHLNAFGETSVSSIFNVPDISFSDSTATWLNLQETEFLPAFFLQHDFPPEKTREMLIAISKQNISCFIIFLPFQT